MRAHEDETHIRQANRDSGPDFRLLFEKLPGNYLVLTPDLRMVAASDDHLRATLTSRDELLGRYLFDVFTDNPEDPARSGPANLAASLERVLASKRRDVMPIQKYDLRRPDGTFEERYWSPINTPILDDHGNVQYIVHQVEDVTQKITLQQGMDRAVREGNDQRKEIEALKAAERLKDQFLSIISHELRTPINAITGFGSILDDELAGPLTEVQHQYLGRMLIGADKLLALVNDLLDMSSIQAGKFRLQPQELRFEPLVAEVLDHLTPLAEQKHLHLERQVPEDLPTIVADPRRVSQVLMNMVTNAIKFTPEGGRILVRAQVDGATLRCDVVDSGIGLAAEDIPKLFKMFTQLDMTPTRTIGGTGLGLSISKALIEAHGGTVGVRSEGPGRGSTFRFSLPLAPKSSDSTAVGE